MWYGKIAIIMTIFSLSISWAAFEVISLYPNTNIATSPNVAWTQTHVQAMAGNYSSIVNLNNGQTPNPALIFGDFITGLTVLLNAIQIAGNAALGGGLSSVLQGIPGIDQNITWLVQIIYGSSEVFLWVYVVANRSL